MDAARAIGDAAGGAPGSSGSPGYAGRSHGRVRRIGDLRRPERYVDAQPHGPAGVDPTRDLGHCAARRGRNRRLRRGPPSHGGDHHRMVVTSNVSSTPNVFTLSLEPTPTWSPAASVAGSPLKFYDGARHRPLSLDAGIYSASYR